MVNESQKKDLTREIEERKKMRERITRTRKLIIKILEKLRSSSHAHERVQAERYDAIITERDSERFWYLVYQKIQVGYEEVGRHLEDIQSEATDLAQINTALTAITYATENYDHEKDILQLKIDPLTKLPIRSELVKDFDTIAGNKAYTFLALVVIDVDNLKPINDNHGHEGGNRYLVDVATGLQEVISTNNASLPFARAYRSGPTGDEFFMLIASNHNNPEQGKHELIVLVQSALEKASTVAAKIGDLTVNGKEIKTGLSCGVALFLPSQKPDFDLMLRVGDQGVFLAKMTATMANEVRNPPQGAFLPEIQAVYKEGKYPPRGEGRWAITSDDYTGMNDNKRPVIQTIVLKFE